MTTRPHPLGGSFSSSRLLMLLPCRVTFSLFFFNDTATTEIYTLSLHDALPIYPADYDDDERFDDDRHPHLGVDAAHGPGEDAGEAREGRADAEDEEPHASEVEAERLHHEGVARARADDEADVGLLEKDEERHEHDDGHADDEEAVEGEVREPEVDGARELARWVEGETDLAPDEPDRLDHHHEEP